MRPSHPSSKSTILTRISMRWVPQPPFETTDTLALAVGEWYVDLRVDRQSGGIDWALAGQCRRAGINPRRVVFTHDIDSHHNFNVSEPCPFLALPSGDDMETGRMRRADKRGAPMTDYEEIWRYIPLQDIPEECGGNTSWVLESVDGALGEGQHLITKRFLAKVGGFYLVQQQKQTHVRSQSADGGWTVKITGEEVSARWEEWLGDHWEEKYVLGPLGGKLPSMAKHLIGKSQSMCWTPGDNTSIRGSQYVVREVESLVAHRARL